MDAAKNSKQFFALIFITVVCGVVIGGIIIAFLISRVTFITEKPDISTPENRRENAAVKPSEHNEQELEAESERATWEAAKRKTHEKYLETEESRPASLTTGDELVGIWNGTITSFEEGKAAVDITLQFDDPPRDDGVVHYAQFEQQGDMEKAGPQIAIYTNKRLRTLLPKLELELFVSSNRMSGYYYALDKNTTRMRRLAQVELTKQE